MTLQSGLKRARLNLFIPFLILLIPWAQEIIDQLFYNGDWNLPMAPGGPLLGVFTAPFSHGGFGHLLANTLTFIPLSWLVLLRGRADYLSVWIGVYAAAIPIWLIWPIGSHGLSGIVYGLLGYLLLIGWLERRIMSLILSFAVLVAYAGVLPSLIPIFSPPGVSWVGHFSGFSGGMLAAWVMARQQLAHPRS
ncbi:MAG: rhomboid family intramembrane serine protease [Synechococcus sp.]|nr:rhomboid family intramembrane serine protease [Synechococcus sp.]